MSRTSTLARVLRELKDERDEVTERKSVYDHDANRAVVALSRFSKILEKANSPDNRRSAPNENQDVPPSIPPEDSEDDESGPEVEADPIPPWAKKAYRLIALRTHPDKISSDDSITDAMRDRLVGIYREATTAYQEKNCEILAEIAAELEIEVEIPAAELERALESKIRSIREEMANIQKTLSWHWGISFGDLQKRVLVLKGCCRIMKLPFPDDSVLEEIVRELESQPDFDIVDRLGRVRRIKSGVERRKVGTRPVKRIR